MMKPAIGLIELSSIARGLLAQDAMMKKAPVELLMSETTSPGKYLVLVNGDVASIQEATQAGIQIAESFLVDSLFIPNVHEQIVPAIKKHFQKIKLDSVGVVETLSVASTIVSADQALKSARVSLIEMRLGQGLGGKGYFVLSGDLSEVEAAVSSAVKVLEGSNMYLRSETIPRPHEDFSVRVSP
ncbi:MAG: BMC domain-containing protein [Deltaproteobacteria bacterium]|nr:BMC domain-containing protein [Deltaproteobacteria bacterium]